MQSYTDKSCTTQETFQLLVVQVSVPSMLSDGADVEEDTYISPLAGFWS